MHGVRNKKIVDIFLYYMYIARVVPSFYEADLQVRENRGTHDIVSCANRKRLSDRVLKKKKKKRKKGGRLLFCTLA